MSLKKINPVRIEQAIADFEKEVDFELVPVITEKSSFVEHVGWLLSLLLLILLISAVDFCLQNSWASKTPYYVAALLAAVILGHVLARLDGLKRLFISKHERDRQVHEKVQRIFFLKHLNELKKHNSLVLFISIMERKIVILPDPRLKFEGLQELQNKMLQVIQHEFRQQQFEQGFLKAIDFLKTELKTRFPRGAGSFENEVPNRLIWWKD